MTAQAREIDRPLLDALERRGFRLDFGEDETGWQFKYLTRGGGYCFNVFCSDLIADGRVALLQFERIKHFDAAGAALEDGSHLPADLLVLATGYKGQEALVERLFGPEVKDRVGPVWGFGDGLELRNMFARTPQPGLWFIAGSFAQCRIYSKYLAFQIKMDEAGLQPEPST
jgi:putative flavoprotein involved in K+ transport